MAFSWRLAALKAMSGEKLAKCENRRKYRRHIESEMATAIGERRQ
jgi:hypothetical protein